VDRTISQASVQSFYTNIGRIRVIGLLTLLF